MKKYFAGVLLAVWILGGAAMASAEPERLLIKGAEQRIKERVAKDQIKNIDLQDIEDPAARRAIQEIYNYLGLKAME